MAISLLSTPMYWILSTAICVIYPSYKTFTHLYSGVLGCQGRSGDDDSRNNCGLFAHHLFYWTVYYVFAKMENSVLALLVPFLPCFYEMKLIVFFWLVSEHFKGAGYLFHRYVMKQVLHASNVVLKEIDEKLDVRNKKTIMDMSKYLGSIEDVTFQSMSA